MSTYGLTDAPLVATYTTILRRYDGTVLGHRSLLLLSLLAAGVVGGCGAERSTAPPGEVVYLRHCASCHGTGGRGDGPVAPTLRHAPSDLTAIARNAGGRFDEGRLIEVIDGRRLVGEHGPREMPVWGVIFDEELKDQPYSQYTVLLRSRTLVDHLHSIQQEQALPATPLRDDSARP